MTRRRVHVETLDARTVKVFCDPEISEYVARLYVAGELYAPADYFTPDRSDAIDTARAMAKPLERSNHVS